MRAAQIEQGKSYLAELPLGQFIVKITGPMKTGPRGSRYWPCEGVPFLSSGRVELIITPQTGRVYAREVKAPAPEFVHIEEVVRFEPPVPGARLGLYQAD